MTIKHLVISGGGPTMIQVLAAIQEIEKDGYINMSDVESIYSTSAGAIIGIMICLKFDWDTLNSYILNRPWQEVFPIHMKTFIDAFYSKGLFGGDTIKLAFRPLFEAKGIPIDITLEKFHEWCGVEHHFFAFDMNTFVTDDISFKTHPNLQLLTALHLTCAIPLMFAPVYIEKKCYIDGGIFCNYPIRECLKDRLESEILGFCNKYEQTTPNNEFNESVESDNLFEYSINFITCLIRNFKKLSTTREREISIPNELICNTEPLGFSFFSNAITSIEARILIFEKGKESAGLFLKSIIPTV
jgi:predicted acylesterase/phospholipase RssA